MERDEEGYAEGWRDGGNVEWGADGGSVVILPKKGQQEVGKKKVKGGKGV
jgi:hypothetical protein